ncbi:hypothetical protein CYMTET_12373, partial [Cymbomonas tetramitiformis]
ASVSRSGSRPATRGNGKRAGSSSGSRAATPGSGARKRNTSPSPSRECGRTSSLPPPSIPRPPTQGASLRAATPGARSRQSSRSGHLPADTLNPGSAAPQAGPSEVATSHTAAATAAEGRGAPEAAQLRPPAGSAGLPPVLRLASKDASAVLAAAAAAAETAPQPWRQDMLDAEAGVRGASALRRGRAPTPKRDAGARAHNARSDSRSGHEQSSERPGRFSAMGSRGGSDQPPDFAIEVHGLGPGAVSVPQRCGTAAGAETSGARRQFTAADFFSAEQLAQLDHEDAPGSSKSIEQEPSEPELVIPRQRTAVPSLRLGSVGGRDHGAWWAATQKPGSAPYSKMTFVPPQLLFPLGLRPTSFSTAAYELVNV